MKTDIMRRLQTLRNAQAVEAHRGKGDVARDRKDWPAAEREYATHLARTPEDQPIWVQYGHCLKEQGKRIEAEAAYRRAIELSPEDADAHLQLGHVLKLLDRKEDAQTSYLTSVGLNPTKAAIEEVQSLSSSATGLEAGTLAARDGPGTIYLEVDDLLDYLRSHATVSGIQRVQVGVIQHMITQLETGQQAYAFVRTGRNASGLWRLDSGDLNSIITYTKQSTVSPARLRGMIEAAEQRATLVEPVRGQLYFILGAFWGFGSNAARYAQLKRAGLHIGVFIYDLIPITHPEYCAAGLVKEFAFALSDGLQVFDFILTISEHVAQDVRRYLAKNDLRPIPVAAVPLAHQIHDAPAEVPAPLQAVAWQGAIAKLQHRPFVLMVSTIEPRKNHIYLYQVWKALLDEGLDPPDLVFVGRYGWRINDLREMLEGTRFLGGRIHVLHDISDVALELLYRSCLFTAFPSVVEGWGLPVGESLTHGCASVASNTTSIPEVGGDLVDYIDPWNIRDGVRVFRKMMFDDAYRAARTRNIREKFVPRTWNDVGKDLLGHLAQFQSLPVKEFTPPALEPGETLLVGDLSAVNPVPPRYASRPLRTLLAASWFPVEPIGAWMRDKEGSIWFATSLAPGTRVVAYLRLQGAPWSVHHHLALHIGQDVPTEPATFPALVHTDTEVLKIVPSAAFLARVSGKVSADGTITITFKVSGETVTDHPARHKDDKRIFYVGMAELAYAAAADIELRVDLSERFSHQVQPA